MDLNPRLNKLDVKNSFRGFETLSFCFILIPKLQGTTEISFMITFQVVYLVDMVITQIYKSCSDHVLKWPTITNVFLNSSLKIREEIVHGIGHFCTVID